jgi:hypothetical protein
VKNRKKILSIFGVSTKKEENFLAKFSKENFFSPNFQGKKTFSHFVKLSREENFLNKLMMMMMMVMKVVFPF